MAKGIMNRAADWLLRLSEKNSWMRVLLYFVLLSPVIAMGVFSYQLMESNLTRRVLLLFVLTITGIVMLIGFLLIRAILLALEEHRRAEQAMRQNESVVRQIIETAHEAFISIDAKSVIREWNRQAELTFGWSRDEAIGRALSETIIPESYRERHRKGMAHFMATGEGPVLSQRIELSAIHKDGHEFPVELTISPLRINGVTVFNSFLHDISDRKKAEVELQMAYAKMARMLASMHEGILLTDGDGKLNMINPAAREMLNIPLDGAVTTEMVVDMFQEGRGRELPARAVAWLHTVLSGQQERVVKDIRFTHPAERDVRVDIQPVRDLKGGIVGSVVLLIDVSKEKAIDRMKSEFVSTVSHELRTPLAIVKEGVSIMHDELYGPINNQQRKFLNVAMSNIDRFGRLIEDLLDISKIEEGRVDLKREEIDIVAVARTAIEQLLPQAQAKTLELSSEPLPKQPISVYADPDKLHQIFVNLIFNAIKFTPEGGRVWVDIAAIDDAVRVQVSDTGIGISEEDLPRVFSKFVQFSRTAGGGAKGTGLGLSIVKGLVELHGGTIGVESRSGSGSVFTFTLPRRGAHGG